MFTSGTALNHIDLLEKVRAYLVDIIGWTQLEYSGYPSPYVSTDQVELHLRAPGWITGGEPYINILTEASVAAGAYGWRMNLSQGFDTSISDGGQVGASPFVYFNTWQNAIPYWIYANDRRVIVIAKCNVSYISMYAGCFLPFALPSERPRPFYIGANYPTLAAHDISNNINSFITAPGASAAYCLGDDAATWNRIESNDTYTEAGRVKGTALGVIWPQRGMNADTQNYARYWSGSGMMNLRPNVNGEMPAWKAHIFNTLGKRIEGVLEGVYCTGGFNRASEQVLTLSGADFRLFQNIFRSTPRDFMAIEEI